MSLRSKVITLYKNLLHLGKDWPTGYDFFRHRLHKAFTKNKDVNDPEEIKKLIKHGEFVQKEIEALYMLKKYRTLKRRYNIGNNSPQQENRNCQ
ncbi:electron transfer flavoprotein regulatory factor 1 isoform X2 [Agrilus planipennis]|uniref:Electron transfer flavoprotein regulatory factor 1 isoform X2 n=1 Tax=Agrilus planipennis TaxID=224129 RepID=A0A1W4WS85_AGRPL|nr:electron transfer flavoprotein regulatory factor 1 isoform X2 [Agrilus planipennis]